MGGLLIAVGGVLDQRALCLLEALGDAATSLGDGTLGWVQLLLAGEASDLGGFEPCRVGLFLLISGSAGHQEDSSMFSEVVTRVASLLISSLYCLRTPMSSRSTTLARLIEVEPAKPTAAVKLGRMNKDLGATNWRARRSFQAGEFPLERLLSAKRESIAVVLPAREVAATIGAIAECVAELQAAGLIDEALVIDSASADGTAEIAAAAGMTVVQENAVAPECGPAQGKGDAMWRALQVVQSDIVAYLDADTESFHAGFLTGLLGPLICDPEIEFVKGCFERPFRDGAQSGSSARAGEGGRVTELLARPLLNLHAPELAVFDQPLAGEVAARRELLLGLPFSVGYGVEIAMLIDAWRAVGLAGLAQVHLGVRQHAHQSLRELSAMAYAVLVAASTRLLGPEFTDAHASGSIALPPQALDAPMELRRVPIEERPPLRGARERRGVAHPGGCARARLAQSAGSRGNVREQRLDDPIDIVILGLDMRLQAVLAQGLARDRADRDDPRLG